MESKKRKRVTSKYFFKKPKTHHKPHTKDTNLHPSTSTPNTTHKTNQTTLSSKKYWLLKSEPQIFSITDLESSPDHTTSWTGVRNYEARNMLKSEMKVGDLAFFYHSNCKIPAIVGIVEIVKSGYQDETQFDKSSHYYDPKASHSDPKWFTVDVKLVRRFEESVTLEELKKYDTLKDMQLLNRKRLSVMIVREKEWECIIEIEKKKQKMK